MWAISQDPQPTRAPDTKIEFDGYSEANVVEWFWTFNTFNPLGYSYEQNPTFQFPVAEGGTYPVQLQITDAQGCVNVVNREIVIQDMFNLFIPTSFTPNNDGTNDAFFVEGTDIDPDRLSLRCGTVGENWCGAPRTQTTRGTVKWERRDNTSFPMALILTELRCTAFLKKATGRKSSGW